MERIARIASDRQQRLRLPGGQALFSAASDRRISGRLRTSIVFWSPFIAIPSLMFISTIFRPKLPIGIRQSLSGLDRGRLLSGERFGGRNGSFWADSDCALTSDSFNCPSVDLGGSPALPLPILYRLIRAQP